MLLDLLGINKVIKQIKCKLQKLENNNNSSGNYVDKYSIDEQIVGEWIDGKPIYRRVYTGTATSGVFSVSGLQSINLKSFITLKVLVKDSGTGNYNTSKEVSLPGNNQIMVIPFSLASATPYFEVRVYNNNISTPLQLDVAVIVEYTKTTD